MAHTAKNKTLGRKAEPRRAMLVGQSNALFAHKKMKTTLAKAKSLARFVAPIITKARVRSTKDLNHAHRQAFSTLKNKRAVFCLFNEVLPQVKERPGGYTRIIKLGQRKGDAAHMAFIELVDFNTLFQKSKKSTTRRGRGKKKLTLSNKAQNSAPALQKKNEKSEKKVAIAQENTMEEATAVATPEVEAVKQAAPIKKEQKTESKEPKQADDTTTA
jgi:large subunit ribosomal protein L17